MPKQWKMSPSEEMQYKLNIINQDKIRQALRSA